MLEYQISLATEKIKKNDNQFQPTPKVIKYLGYLRLNYDDPIHYPASFDIEAINPDAIVVKLSKASMKVIAPLQVFETMTEMLPVIQLLEIEMEKLELNIIGVKCKVTVKRK